ncbi:peptidoglycan/LPS O-acetylase OafA/YrhL [Janthinobacterium sp. CG_23.3]|uniref:acyltransferase family protein n=1 Tax=unclassified Janthinobacterium TaxID=2610881 RepID=UPI0003456B07|nr:MULTISPECIES: acyltransferase [unclassified Janthinobacterium]MEC5161185.1 peptidoglycan/LPS O-acetylase OafA/YrhL [Janthinobacterium sp. CG_S6]
MSARAGDGAAAARGARLVCLDGLRGWAAVMVVLSHLWGQFARHLAPFYDQPLLRLVSDGHLAVLIFFVLSGVALSLRFVRRPQRVSLVGLVAARYVRLMVPVLATTLLVYLLIALRLAGSADAARAGNSAIFLGARHGQDTTLADALAFSFYSVFFDYDEGSTFNWSLWTMHIELLGSLLIFTLLFLFSRAHGLTRRHRMALAGALAFAFLLMQKQFGACFAAGYVLAELAHAAPAARTWLRWAPPALAAAAAAVAAWAGRRHDSSGALLAVGIVMAALFWPVARRFLASPVSAWLGRISFPLYLIHVPLIGAAGELYLALLNGGVAVQPATHATVVLAFCACLLSAALLMPLERLSMRLSTAAGTLRLARRRALPAPPRGE